MNYQGYDNFSLRLIASLLCFFLIIKGKWPPKLRRWLPIYWYMTLLYCLPFLFTFLLFKNNFSYTSVLNTMTVLVLSVLLLDMLALSIILPLGIILGIIFFKLAGGIIILPENLPVIITTYLSVIIFGGLFARGKELIKKQRLYTMQSLSSSMAHELRTPLASINVQAAGIKKYLSDITESSSLLKNRDTYLTKQVDNLFLALDQIKAESNYANTVINILLVKSNQTDLNPREFKNYSIVDSVNKALTRYPFTAQERSLVTYEAEDDFIYRGNELLTIHVLFNLLKNSLYYVKAAGKGDIKIWTRASDTLNYLHFKDTGAGITKSILPKIFDRFFTNTYHGSGVGLAFCKLVMQAYGGNIVCQSIEGEFAEFILTFPKIIAQ